MKKHPWIKKEPWTLRVFRLTIFHYIFLLYSYFLWTKGGVLFGLNVSHSLIVYLFTIFTSFCPSIRCTAKGNWWWIDRFWLEFKVHLKVDSQNIILSHCIFWVNVNSNGTVSIGTTTPSASLLQVGDNILKP